MSLATSCPSCGTVFRVVQDQLKISEGWVRCGHCQEVFNALEGLFDLNRRDTSVSAHGPSPELATPATSDPNDPAWAETRPAMFSGRKTVADASWPAPPGAPTPPAPAPAPPAPPTRAPVAYRGRIEISSRRTATWDPSVQDPERGLAPTEPDPGTWRTTRAGLPPSSAEPSGRPSRRMAPPADEPDTVLDDSLFGGPPTEVSSLADETAYPATTLEFRSEAFSAFASARLQRHGVPDVDLSIGHDEPPAQVPAPAPAVHQTPAVPPAAAAAEPAPRGSPVPEPAWHASGVHGEPDPALERTLDLNAGAAPVTAPRIEAPPPVPVPAPSPAPAPHAPPSGRAEAQEMATAAVLHQPLQDPAPSAADDDEPVIATDHPGSADRHGAAAASPSPSPNAARTDVVPDERPELPDFVRRADSQARWQRPVVRAALSVAAIGLAGLLAAQGAIQARDRLAARWPSTRPALEAACRTLGCEIRPPRLLDALVVDNTTLTRPPGLDGYQLGISLHNRADHAVAAPHIELSLTDMSGAVVIRRVLAPTEFRQGDALPGQSDAQWNLAFTSTNPRIVGYTLAAFYP